MADLGGKVALVTGASAGLGRRFATVLAGAGAAVVLAARRLDRLEALEAEIAAAGGTALPVQMDVTEPASIEAALARAGERLGPVGILVNNAGIATDKPFLEQSPADFDTVIATNLRGPFLVAQAAARRMVAAGTGGSIVNIGSVLGFRPLSNVSPYVAAKGGLHQLTRGLALELARHQIRVNALAPGYFRTEMNQGFFAGETGQRLIKGIPQRRLGDEGDLDGALLLLASDAGRYITGQVLAVDGGFTLA